MNKPELIAFDLDDTLLRDDGTISERTLHDLHRLAKEGIITVIATGRMYATAKPYADLLALPDMPLILFSGALIQKISGEKLYEKPCHPSLRHRLIRRLLDTDGRHRPILMILYMSEKRTRL